MAGFFPRTTVAGISLPRMIIGTNWLLGFSHRGAACDHAIREKYTKAEDFYPVLSTFMSHGIDAIMGPLSNMPHLVDGIHYTEDKLGQKMILIDTPGLNTDDSREGRAGSEEIIRDSAAIGSDFCLIHHTSVEKLVCKETRTINRLPDYLTMIREAGMKPGLSAHMPEVVVYTDENDYDVETYIQIFNCVGFLMQVEVESVVRIIRNAKHPVMTIKPFAAGRITPFVGLNFNWNVIRDCDMITCGTNTAEEAEEDIEISLAALEHRYPDLAARSSPVKQEILGHK